MTKDHLKPFQMVCDERPPKIPDVVHDERPPVGWREIYDEKPPKNPRTGSNNYSFRWV